MDYRGISAIIIAVALGLALLVAIAGSIVTGRPISEKGLEVIAVIGGALVGALAGYIAGTIEGPRR